jgi:solute carrier family 25 (mitochondrial citrate transporter), member 1
VIVAAVIQTCRPEPGPCRMQEGKLNNSRRMAAGFAAGVTEALMIVTPFEVVKIRLQQQQGSNKAALLYKVGAMT